MTQQNAFSLLEICRTLHEMEQDDVVVAIRRETGDRARDFEGAPLASWVAHMRRTAGPDVLEQILIAILVLARRAGRSDGTAWRISGRIPITPGYNEAKWEEIRAAIRNAGAAPYGSAAGGLDERLVEYPWIFDRIAAAHRSGEPVLDAGSVMNFSDIVAEWANRAPGPLSIVTLCHEGQAFPSDHVRYEYSDLRRLPYRDGWFSTVLSISTLEHVGMDTTIYGGDTPRCPEPEAEMARALAELDRVTAEGGLILISVPFGRSDDRGWLRILDLAEVERIGQGLPWQRLSLRIFRAFEEGWREVDADVAGDAGYNEPTAPPERRTAPDWVAAAEAVALIEFRKQG